MTTNKTEPHIVVGSDRMITVPDELKNIAVQYDHNVETVTFDCPRYWDDLDMSTMIIYINYICPDNVKGTYLVSNVTIDEEDDTIMHFNWTISRNVTLKIGQLSFLVNIKNIDEEGNMINNWSSAINNEMKISKGIDNSNDISEKYPDVLSNLILSVNKCFQYASDGKNAISEAITGTDERVRIPDEATFEQLAECIGQISTGFKLATGEMKELTIPENIVGETPFRPKFIIIYNFGSGLGNFNMGIFVSQTITGVSGYQVSDSANGLGGKLSRKANVFTITDNGFEMINSGAVTNLKWFALGL